MPAVIAAGESRRSPGDGVCLIDIAEVIVKIFEARDPVRGSDEAFDARACRPAELIARLHESAGLNARRQDFREVWFRMACSQARPPVP